MIIIMPHKKESKIRFQNKKFLLNCHFQKNDWSISIEFKINIYLTLEIHKFSINLHNFNTYTKQKLS
jgi:hypothetical protein